MSTPQTLEFETPQPEVAPAAPTPDNSTNEAAARLALTQLYAEVDAANAQPGPEAQINSATENN